MKVAGLLDVAVDAISGRAANAHRMAIVNDLLQGAVGALAANVGPQATIGTAGLAIVGGPYLRRLSRLELRPAVRFGNSGARGSSSSTTTVFSGKVIVSVR